MTRRVLTRLALALVAMSAVVVSSVSPAYAGASINGGGSGFAALEMDQWRADTARSPFNLAVNYVAQGSSFGRAQFTAGTFDFGVSDIQYISTEQQPPKPFVYVPVSAGGVAFMYNLPDASGRPVTNLRLTRRAVCKIFTGTITKWNDPEIVKYNPSLASFDRVIHPVIRADGAGESYVFSEFCIADAPDIWSAFVAQQHASPNSPNLLPEFLAGQPVSNWPAANWGPNNDVNPVSIPYADGTANYVADPSGGADSISYMAAGYAKVRNAPVASVQNAAGVFTQPDEDNVTVALGYATPRGNGTFKLAYNGPDPRAYFPSTYSYVLAPASASGPFGPDKGATLAAFLCYAVSEGQVIAPQLRYARLSSALVNIAIDAIVRIPGAPSKQDCPVAGAPPPPPPPTVLGGGGGSATASGTGTGTDNSSGTGTGTGTVAAGSSGKRAGGATPGADLAAAAHTKASLASARRAAKAATANAARIAQEVLNAELANAALGSGSRSSGGGSPTAWWVLGGLCLAGAVNAVVTLRKKAAA